MIPSVVGLLVIGLGVVLIYLGLHGVEGILTVNPYGLYDAYRGQPATTPRNPT